MYMDVENASGDTSQPHVMLRPIAFEQMLKITLTASFESAVTQSLLNVGGSS